MDSQSLITVLVHSVIYKQYKWMQVIIQYHLLSGKCCFYVYRYGYIWLVSLINLLAIRRKTELIYFDFFSSKIAFVLLVAACVYAKPKPDIVAYSAPLVAAPYSSAVVSRELYLQLLENWNGFWSSSWN